MSSTDGTSISNNPPYYSDEEEDSDDYRIGGYHPVKSGDSFKSGRYTVLSKLGWGHFSTVWLAKDSIDNATVALKIVKSERHYTEAALDEIKLLQVINKEKIKIKENSSHFPVVILLDNFFLEGPHGNHVCMVFEVLGDNLLALLRRTNNHMGLDLPLVKRITRQVLEGIDFLHNKCQIIHTDIKPENILLVSSKNIETHLNDLKITDNNGNNCNEGNVSSEDESLISVKIADLGNACWVDKHFTEDIQTRQYRAPEVIIGTSYSKPADIWSVACLVFELVTGDFLFSPKSSSHFPKDEDHLAQILELLGRGDGRGRIFLSQAGTYSPEFFNKRGEFRHIRDLDYWPLDLVLKEKYRLDPNVIDLLVSFLLPMLEINPTKRITASEALKHSFLK